MTKILLIDNYDSFTYNIYQIVAEQNENTKVYRNNEITIEKIYDLNPEKIIISPGPSHPKNSGICREVVNEFGTKIPILGVCLGHQVIGYTYGSIIEKAPTIFHGKTSLVEHNNHAPAEIGTQINMLFSGKYSGNVIDKISTQRSAFSYF